MPKENYPRPSLSQQETDFLKKFSLRKFTVPKEKLKEHSPFLYQQKNEDLDIDQFTRKRFRIEYKELKRSLKTNVPWWLRAKGLEEDMNTERLAVLVEDSDDDDYYSARLDAGVDRQQALNSCLNKTCVSEAPSSTLSPELSSSSRRGIQIIEEFLKIAESSIGKISDSTHDGIFEVEKRLTKVHRILNNLEHVRLDSGCEKCQGKDKNKSLQCDNNDLLEHSQYPEISLNSPDTRLCVCDLEYVDTEIENLCCCLQGLLEENGFCNDPCHYAAIIEQLQEIRQYLYDFTKRVMFCSKEALYPDPLSRKFENDEYLNECERERRTNDVSKNCLPIAEECGEKSSKSKGKSKGKSDSYCGEKNNSDTYDVIPHRKQPNQNDIMANTNSYYACEIEDNYAGSPGNYSSSTDKVMSNRKDKKSKTRKKCGCFGKNVTFEGKERRSGKKTKQSSSKTTGPEESFSQKEHFYICCKETQTDYGNCNDQGRPMFIPCIVLKQALGKQSSSFNMQTGDNMSEKRNSPEYLEPNCGRMSSNSAKNNHNNNQQQCMCKENSNSEDACTDMYFCTPLNQNSIEDDERCKDRPQAGISKVDNKLKNVCPHCCKCFSPHLDQLGLNSENGTAKLNIDSRYDPRKPRTSCALKVSDPKSRSLGETSSRNNSEPQKGICAPKYKEERLSVREPELCHTTHTSGRNTKAESKDVCFSQMKETSASKEKQKPCTSIQDATRKCSLDREEIRDESKGVVEKKHSLACQTKERATSQHALKDRTSNFEDGKNRVREDPCFQNVPNTLVPIQHSSKEKNSSKTQNSEGNICNIFVKALESLKENNKISEQEEGTAVEKRTNKRTECTLSDTKGTEMKSDQNISQNQILQSRSLIKEQNCSEKILTSRIIAANDIQENQNKDDDQFKLTPPSEMGNLRNQEISRSGRLRKKEVIPQPKLDVQVKVKEPRVIDSELKKPENKISQQIKIEQNDVDSPETGLDLKKACKNSISDKSKVTVESCGTVSNLEPKNSTHSLNGKRNGQCLSGNLEKNKDEEKEILSDTTDIKDDKICSGPFKADPNISQPEQEIRVCLYNKRRSSKKSKGNGAATGAEIGTLSTKLPTKFCNDCFGKNVPIIKNNLADEIRKMIGNRKRNNVFLKFTVVKDDLYHMQMSTESAYLGCLYATESATFAARDANGFDGCTTLSVTDKSNTRAQIESLVDHAFMVVQHEKRSSN